MNNTFRCEYCGSIFDITEARSVYDPDEGDIAVCPHCGWDSCESVEQCSICGKYYTEDELTLGGGHLDRQFCEDCLLKYAEDPKKLRTIEKQDRWATEGINISALVYTVLSVPQIEQLCMDYIQEHKDDPDIRASLESYVTEDKSWFADQLVEYLKTHKED